MIVPFPQTVVEESAPPSPAPDHQPDHRPDVYLENGVTVFRASSLGGCLANLIAARQGFNGLPFPEKIAKAASEGSLHEPAILKALEDTYNITILSRQDEIEFTVAEGVIIRGHTDGRGIYQGEEVGIEVKAFSQDNFERYLREGIKGYLHYAWQVSIYMLATGLPFLFVVKNRNRGELHLTLITEPPIDEITIKTKVFQVEALARAGELPVCDGKAQWPCPRFYLHHKGQEQASEYEIDTDTVIDGLALAYEQARDSEKIAAAKKEVARGRLLEALGERPRVRTALYSVTRSQVKRTSLDARRLQEELPEVHEKYVKETVSEQLRVTGTKETA